MSQKIKVAVLQCVYSGDNVDDFSKSLASICGQQDLNIVPQLYMCIDGPVDSGVHAVLSEYNSIIKKIIYNDVRVGLANSLNKLICEIGDEDYVARMDSDDFSLPGRFKSQINFLENNKYIDACGGAIIEWHKESGKKVLRSYPKSQDIRIAICKGVPIAHPTAMFRRDFFDKFGKYPASDFNQDIGLWFNAVSLGAKLSNLEEPVLEYSIGSSFASRRSMKKAIAEFDIYIRGIYRLHGMSPLLIYPALRFLFRLMPKKIITMVYEAGVWRNGSTKNI